MLQQTETKQLPRLIVLFYHLIRLLFPLVAISALAACVSSDTQQAATAVSMTMVGSAQSPLPTPTATSTATVAPMATVKSTGVPPAASPAELQTGPIEPQVMAAMIRFGSWSPGSETLAYWTFTTQEAAVSYTYPPGTLHFLKVRTGQICPYPYDATYGYAPSQLIWLPDGKVIVYSGDQAREGTPCGEDFTAITGETSTYASAPASSVSPKGGHRASTVSRMEADGTLSAVTTLVEVSTGQVEDVISWKHRGGEGELGLGGQWLTEGQFLINEALEQGPLLVTVGEGIVQVAPELFRASPVPSPSVGLAATAAAVTGTNTYHIVLAGVGTEADFPRIRLYHSETGEVEELDFQHLWWPGFSPDGRWLALFQPPTETNMPYSVWLRPIDPAGSEARLFLTTDDEEYPCWSPDSTKVAIGSPRGTYIFSVEAGHLIGFWETGDYSAYPLIWSPDGQFLAVHGYVSGKQQEALFIIRKIFN